MTEIKNKAEQYLMPFDETVRYIAENGTKADYIEMFILLDSLSPPDAWKKSVISSESRLTADEKRILVDFGCALCSCSREQIGSYSERMINEMNQKYISLSGNKDKNTRIVSALSLSAGLAVVTVLI